LKRESRLNEYCNFAGERLRGDEQISPESTQENNLEGLGIIKLILD